MSPFPLVGFASSRSGASGLARRLRHFRFRAGLRLQRLWHRCDLALRAWGANRLAREIEHWPDDRLKDIGLSRADVSRAIAGLRRPYQWVPDHDDTRMHPSRFGH